MPRTSRSLGLLGALALAAPLLAAAGSAAADPAPSAAAAAPALSFWAPPEVDAYAYRKRVWTDLGLRLVADGAPFEVRAHRDPGYDGPIEAVWRSADGEVPLPDGAMTDFSGLRDFLRLDITSRRRGFEPVHQSRGACLNSYGAQRVRPDAPAKTPYPVGCWYNAYTLGSVQGIQAGWANPLLGFDGRPLRLAPGTYRVRASIAPQYVEAFGLDPATSTRTVRLHVHSEEGADQRARRAPSAVARPAAAAPTGPQGAPAATPRPDLRSLPAWGLALSPNGRFLRFSATVWNAGDSPLVVDGFRRESEDLMDAYQYFFDADGEQVGYEPVGQMHFDHKPSHQHWHFEDFARYSLLDAGHVEQVRSKKEAFCLANTDAVDLTVPDAAWQPENTRLETSCGDESSLSIREVLAAGWGDTYTQYRAGQSFDLRGLPNGIYFVQVLANPDGNLVESDTTNNESLRKIKLGGTPDHRRLKVWQVGDVVEEGYGGQG